MRPLRERARAVIKMVKHPKTKERGRELSVRALEIITFQELLNQYHIKDIETRKKVFTSVQKFVKAIQKANLARDGVKMDVLSEALEKDLVQILGKGRARAFTERSLEMSEQLMRLGVEELRDLEKKGEL